MSGARGDGLDALLAQAGRVAGAGAEANGVAAGAAAGGTDGAGAAASHDDDSLVDDADAEADMLPPVYCKVKHNPDALYKNLSDQVSRLHAQ